jgi:hypothetical protein
MHLRIVVEVHEYLSRPYRRGSCDGVLGAGALTCLPTAYPLRPGVQGIVGVAADVELRISVQPDVDELAVTSSR